MRAMQQARWSPLLVRARRVFFAASVIAGFAWATLRSARGARIAGVISVLCALCGSVAAELVDARAGQKRFRRQDGTDDPPADGPPSRSPTVSVTSRRVLAVARCLLLALNLLLLSSPDFFEPRLGTSLAFLLVTILLTLLNVVLVVFWDRLSPPAEANEAPFAWTAAVVVVLAAGLLIAAAAATWLREILIYPLDARRADMLVVVQAAIGRLLQGGNPYSFYDLPWHMPLSYGPLLWAPFILPFLVHADLRFLSLAGMLFVPVACGIASVTAAAHGRRALSFAWLIVLLAIAVSPDLHGFMSVAHTPVYWPLLAVLAWLVTREQWYGAAVACGLLIVARTTMVSIAPVLLTAVWYRARPRFPVALVLLSAATLLPFLPFAILDFRTLQYGMYGVYQNVEKWFVWTETTWVQHTIGTTALMLARGWGRAVEIVQIVVMIAVYVMGADALGRGRRPLPWMALALLAFSMTTLWPVRYIYLDVFVLLVFGALSELPWVRTRNIAITAAMVLAASLGVVAMATWVMVPINATIDAGTATDRPYLYSGFSGDERTGEVTFAWIDGTRADLLLPRRSRRDATIEIVCEPFLPARDAVQRLSASLNGTDIGSVDLTGGWHHVELRAPGPLWHIGVNELTLSLSTAVPPKELGLSEDRRRLSLALDRVIVRTP
jgi:hypothetical protein